MTLLGVRVSRRDWLQGLVLLVFFVVVTVGGLSGGTW